MNLDEEIYELGYDMLAGIDEVGRGCLYGDVVACAIIMPKGKRIEGVMDSKKLSEKKRNLLNEIILEDAIAVGIGRIDSKIIDQINIKQATRLAMKIAVENLKNKDDKIILPEILLVDAEEVDLDMEQKSIIKGDEKSYSISCASIVAKVHRDNLCLAWDVIDSGYGIAKHKGYGTKLHREKILELGIRQNHRLSFLKNILK